MMKTIVATISETILHDRARGGNGVFEALPASKACIYAGIVAQQTSLS